MVKEKRLEASKTTMSSPTQANFAQSDTSNQVTHAHAIEGANYDLLTGSHIDTGQGMNARIAYHQPASAVDGASHEHEDFAPLRAAARVRRQDPVDHESSSTGKMWDPVKDCRHPKTVPADLLNFPPAAHHSREAFMDSTISMVASTNRHSCHDEYPHGQAQDDRQQFVGSGTRGAATIGLLPYPESNAMASGYQGSASMGLQPFQVSHSYDKMITQPHHQSTMEPSELAIQRSHQLQSGYENISILPPRFKDSSGQNGNQSLESLTRGAASMALQPRQAAYSHGHSQENGQQLTGMESRRPASMVSNESTRPRPPPPSKTSNLSRQRSDSQQADRLQRQSPSASMSQALSIARHAETLDQQSNCKEAVRAYERACAVFQQVIIRSCSFEERMKCNDARNSCQARLDVLSRNSAASSSNTPPEQENQQEDDVAGRGKPQYSLLEDLALCHKEEEDLSWQEVAEKPMFKGKRKHRSLSQRKHTISKMGPKYREPEIPWTEEEDRKLCALGDAGRTLGDIHRKFRSRNAERCLNRYFCLKGYRTTGRSHTHTSRQARQAPALYPLSTQHTHSSSVVARHRGYCLHSSTLVVDPVSRRKSICPSPPTSTQNIPSLFALRRQTSGMPSSSSPFPGAEAACFSKVPMSQNNAASSEQFEPQSPYSSIPSRQQGLPARSSSSFHSIAEAPTYSTPPMPLENPSSPEAVRDTSNDRLFNSRHPRPVESSSSSSASTAKNSTNSTTPTSSANSPEFKSTPPNETHDSRDSQSAAVNGFLKSRRIAHLDTV